MNTHVDLGPLMEPVALHLLGDPNQQCSTKAVKRWGSRGSFSVNLDKGTFYDHETGTGGGPPSRRTRNRQDRLGSNDLAGG